MEYYTEKETQTKEYYTEEGTRKAIEKRLKRRIPSHVWGFIKLYFRDDFYRTDEDLDYDMPYIEEISKRFCKSKADTDRRLTNIVCRKADKGAKTIKASILLEEFLRVDLRKNSEVLHVLEEAEHWRNKLGFPKPIPIRNLRSSLIVKGASSTMPGNPLPYPVKREIFPIELEQIMNEGQGYVNSEAKKLMGEITEFKRKGGSKLEIVEMIDKGLYDIREKTTVIFKERISGMNWWQSSPIRFWDINYLFVPPHNSLFKDLTYFSDTISKVEQCHPALGLACILCDLPLFPRRYPKLEVIRDGRNIQIYVNSLEVSPKVVAYVHRLVRNDGIRQKRGVQGKWARPRPPKQKTQTLFRFCEDNKAMDWEDRRFKWNRTYPQWKYDRKLKMQITYYKAKRRLINLMKGVNNEKS